MAILVLAWVTRPEIAGHPPKDELVKLQRLATVETLSPLRAESSLNGYAFRRVGLGGNEGTKLRPAPRVAQRLPS
jgi:hypothetical protein